MASEKADLSAKSRLAFSKQMTTDQGEMTTLSASIS